MTELELLSKVQDKYGLMYALHKDDLTFDEFYSDMAFLAKYINKYGEVPIHLAKIKLFPVTLKSEDEYREFGSTIVYEKTKSFYKLIEKTSLHIANKFIDKKTSSKAFKYALNAVIDTYVESYESLDGLLQVIDTYVESYVSLDGLFHASELNWKEILTNVIAYFVSIIDTHNDYMNYNI